MWFENSEKGIVVHREDEEVLYCRQVLAAMANSIDIDFIDVCNDGEPVFLGNDYAQYEFTAILGGRERKFALGPIELQAILNGTGTLLEPYDEDEIALAVQTGNDGLYCLTVGPIIYPDLDIERDEHSVTVCQLDEAWVFGEGEMDWEDHAREFGEIDVTGLTEDEWHTRLADILKREQARYIV